jgi:hypothetical protein
MCDRTDRGKCAPLTGQLREWVSYDQQSVGESRGHCLAFKTDAFLFLAHLGQTAEAKWFETDKIGFGMAVALVTDEIKKEGACTHELGSGKRKLEASQRQS